MEFLEVIKEYVRPELLVLAVVLYFIGKGIKNSETIKDKYIPIILGIIGVVISAIYIVATSDIAGYQSVLMMIFTSLVQGVLVAGLAVYANENITQLKKEE